MSTTASETKTNKSRWFPLESNPALLNKYISNLGFDISSHKFYDVYSTEEWALGMVPQPAAAVIMLYPLTKTQVDYQKEEGKLGKEETVVKGNEGEKATSSSVTNQSSSASSTPSVWHMKQRIGNACGTVGVLHALGNLPEHISKSAIASDSWLGKFYSSCSTELDPVAKAEKLESDQNIERMHDSATSDSSNQTSRGSLDDSVMTHFIALVNVDGGLYELDGRKVEPVKHGETTTYGFLKDACKVVEKFMKRDPGELRFTIMALCPTTEE